MPSFELNSLQMWDALNTLSESSIFLEEKIGSPSGITQFLPTGFSLILKELLAMLVLVAGVFLVVTGTILCSERRRQKSQSLTPEVLG